MILICFKKNLTVRMIILNFVRFFNIKNVFLWVFLIS